MMVIMTSLSKEIPFTISRTMGTSMLMMATFEANSVETAAVSVMITIMSGAGRLLSTLSDCPSVFVRPVFYSTVQYNNLHFLTSLFKSTVHKKYERYHLKSGYHQDTHRGAVRDGERAADHEE